MWIGDVWMQISHMPLSWSSPQGLLIPSVSPSSVAPTVSFQDRPKCGGLFHWVHVLYFPYPLGSGPLTLSFCPMPPAQPCLPLPPHHTLCTALDCRWLPDWALAGPVS